MLSADVEGLAAYIIERGGFGDEPDPWDVIAAFGARVVQALPGERPHAERRPDGGWDLVVDATERRERVGTTAVHELSHPVLLKAGLPNDEDHAWLLTAGILLPRSTYLRRFRTVGGHIERLAAFYPHVSHELLGRRAVELLGDRVLHVWDVEPRENRYRVASRGWKWRRREPLPVERETMHAALESRGPVELVGGVRAWPVVDGAWVRVLCLSDGEVLLAHL